MPAQVGRENMPAQAERRNHREKNLPPPPQSVQQHQRRTVLRTLGIVQLNIAGIQGVLDKSRMIFAHNVLT